MVTVFLTPDELAPLELSDVALASPVAEDALEDPVFADALEDTAFSEEPPAPAPDEELVTEQPHALKAKTTNATAQIMASASLVSFDKMHLPHVT
ncbi:MAG: hypothetical protein IJI68_03950 [Eggerthellaceae bacterium]|nr:hypothetical protein [Eggerthellaceae bacterium]